MPVWQRVGLALTMSLAAAVAVGVNAAPAGAVSGLLGHYEVCTSDGEYGFIESLSVRSNVVVAEKRDDVVRVLSRGGRQTGRIEGTGRPGEEFRDPIVGTSPAGTLYVVSDSTFSGLHLYKFNGRSFEREFALNQPPFGSGGRLTSPVGLFGSVAGSRSSKSGEVVVGDAIEGLVIFESDGTFNERYPLREGASRGRLEGISAAPPGFILLALNSDADGIRSQVAVLGGVKPIRPGYNFNVGTDFLKDVAGAPDGTLWALGQSNSGFSGLEHYDRSGQLLDRVPISGGLYGVAVGPDGEVWVSRQDGLLRIGSGGGTIPPDQFGRGKCGAPQVRTRVAANQRIVRSRQIVLLASCSERCTVQATGRMSVPGGAARTFKLRGVKRRLASGKRTRLRLKLSRKAARALGRAVARGRPSRVKITLRASDAAKTKSSRTVRLTIR